MARKPSITQLYLVRQNEGVGGGVICPLPGRLQLDAGRLCEIVQWPDRALHRARSFCLDHGIKPRMAFMCPAMNSSASFLCSGVNTA